MRRAQQHDAADHVSYRPERRIGVSATGPE